MIKGLEEFKAAHAQFPWIGFSLVKEDEGELLLTCGDIDKCTKGLGYGDEMFNYSQDRVIAVELAREDGIFYLLISRVGAKFLYANDLYEYWLSGNRKYVLIIPQGRNYKSRAAFSFLKVGNTFTQGFPDEYRRDMELRFIRDFNSAQSDLKFSMKFVGLGAKNTYKRFNYKYTLNYK